MALHDTQRARLHDAHGRGVPQPEVTSGTVIAALRELLELAEEGAVPDLDQLADGVIIDLERDGVRCVVLATHHVAADVLSPREMQIARMVAEGCTNRAIATTLEISLWTVSTHLRRIFMKVGACSRAEMVGQVFGSIPAPRTPAT